MSTSEETEASPMTLGPQLPTIIVANEKSSPWRPIRPSGARLAPSVFHRLAFPLELALKRRG